MVNLLDIKPCRFVVLLLCCIVLFSCKKEDDGGKWPDKKWVYRSMQNEYLWGNHLPPYENVASDGEMTAFYERLRYRYNKGVPKDRDYYGDRFSGIHPKNSQLNISRNTNEYILDLGIQTNVYGPVDGANATISRVDFNSPAYESGLRGGETLRKIKNLDSGETLELPIDYEKYSKGLNAALEAHNVEIEYETLDSGTSSVTLSRASYKESPVYNLKRIDNETCYIGYSHFPVGEAASASNMSVLESAFSAISASSGIKNLIVDLRGNGGGGVIAVHQLASLLAPPAYLGSVYCYMQNKDGGFRPEYLLSSPNIHSLNPDLEKLYFVCDFLSASASEMLVHCMRALYQESGRTCKLVNDSKTCGKNVGGYTYESTKYDWTINLISMRVCDKNHVSGYETGLVPDIPLEQTFDIWPYGRGDMREYPISVIMNDIDAGRYPLIRHTGSRSGERNYKPIIDITFPVRERGNDLILGHEFVPDEYYL